MMNININECLDVILNDADSIREVSREVTDTIVSFRCPAIVEK